jgi:hypothetical protein
MTRPIKTEEIKREILGRYFPKKLANILYREKFEKEINWSNPKDLNEKINWIAFYTDTRNWTRLADKYAVREYVKSKGYDNILTNLLGVWESPGALSFNKLPKEFILKCNHDAGTVFLIEDKAKINETEVKNQLKVLMKRTFGVKTAEPHYIGIKKKIIAEEFITNDNHKSNSLIDYKFWCFHGKAYYCHVVYDKNVYKDKKTDIYSLPGWGKQKNKIKDNSENDPLPKPLKLKEMIEVAESLSNNFFQCRVDLYFSNSQIYFGELTFTSACGRIKNYTEDFLKELGSKIHIK